MTKDEQAAAAMDRVLKALKVAPEGDLIFEAKLSEAEDACFILKDYELSNKLLDELGL